MLATVLFTDIVDSTRTAAEIWATRAGAQVLERPRATPCAARSSASAAAR